MVDEGKSFIGEEHGHKTWTITEKLPQMERWTRTVTLPNEDWKRKKRKLNSQRQRYCRSDMHSHPKMSIPWANSIKNTYSLSLHVWDLKQDGTHFFMMFRNWRKIVFCCCCFWIPRAIFIGNLRQRQREQSQKSHAAQGENTVHKVICSSLNATSWLVVWDWPGILWGRRIKNQTTCIRKMKNAGCGGEGGSSSWTCPKSSVNVQTNHNGKGRCCVNYLPKLFQHILLSFWLLLLCWSHFSLFVLPCFQRESSVLTEMGHMAQHFDKQVLCCLQWESTSGTTFGYFISGCSHKE